MKITAQEEYGLRCLLRLAQAEQGQSLTLGEVAAAEGLSVPYAAKLLAVLRQAGMIESVRGRLGGYRLARAPAGIGMGSLLLVLGEPLFDEPNYCERHPGTADGVNSCVHHGGCSLRALWGTQLLTPSAVPGWRDRKSTRLNSSHVSISYAVFCLKKKKH